MDMRLTFCFDFIWQVVHSSRRSHRMDEIVHECDLLLYRLAFKSHIRFGSWKRHNAYGRDLSLSVFPKLWNSLP